MIGYMRPIKKQFEKEQRNVYQSMYCGLCKCLKYEYGHVSTVALNYELVDTLLLIAALKDEEMRPMKVSCSWTPFIWREMIGLDEAVFYLAAGLSVLIVDLELADNVQDDGRWFDELLLKAADHKAKHFIAQHRTEYTEVLRTYREYMDKEKEARESGCGFWKVLNASGKISGNIGRMLAECEKLPESQEIEAIMELWGQWIYLVDAADDYQKDLKDKKFNPWMLADAPDSWESYIEGIERQAGGQIMNLPIRRYWNLIETLYLHHIPERRRRVFQECR